MISKAQELEQAALKENNPNKKLEFLLLASEIYLKESKNDSENQSKYLAKAIQLYDEYESINANSIKYLDKEVNNKKGVKTFDDIGGLEELKDEIKLKIIEPLLHPEVFSAYGKKIGGGILMYGPPGCGKSLIAEATAGEANAHFIHVKPSDLKSKYVGETEKNISKLFEVARANAPTIIFFDEFESFGRERSKTDVHTKNHISQLLSEMDGVGTKDKAILLLAATNTPWEIDPALIRHGRFGINIFVKEPDEKARKEIIKLNLENKPIDDSVNIDFLAKVTKGFSGADLSEICDRGADIAIKEYFKTKVSRKINIKDFISILKEKKSIVKSWYKLAKEQIVINGCEDYYTEIANYHDEKSHSFN
ncbi:ATP-binding protein [Candidatus Woesearchaeota archaeon]|jgi:transitional endoplasmic reticulum ATPase|nr:ATP-binding protein [Candidatus Woesearchaeota archaeon]MBT4735498.1 ATP-binding protein [Candidatus Neomarinimicrobiota bacterium]MBT4387018.1 ATP-binding protein [Candidatus Woesearchaeota archaeon]MBT4595932.1 ATP-binding protein [Candidatus Woesearchaeota archaeon]MBT5741062.1 ATP-binding protein [Candidatus Woesearchaeota archaeon]